VMSMNNEAAFVLKTNGTEETRLFAKRLANYLRPGNVIALTGDLGAGKTTFTQGLAEGLGISERVNSPTFTIIKEYQGRLPLYHMDVYRLDGTEELGLEEYFAGAGITVVEWPTVIEDFLPDELLWIEIVILSADEREIKLFPHGEEYKEICKEITHEYSRD